MPSPTGARLARAFLAYLLGVLIIVTLVPFDFGVVQPRLVWAVQPADVVANVAMFLPIGFLAHLTGVGEDQWALRPLLIALAASTAVELAQLFLPSRYSSPVDVLTNGLGGWIGGLAAATARRRIRLTPALLGRLALELPLMGLLYLLIPLLWVSGLAAAGSRGRTLLALVLGLAGARILGAVYQSRLGPGGVVSRARFAAVGAAWFGAGGLAGLATAPRAVLLEAVAIGWATWWWSGAARGAVDRRFERATLARVAPILGAYLLLLAAWPWPAPWTSWHGGVSLAALWGTTGTAAILRVLEHLAAFTVLGYALAEAAGRREASWGTVLPLVALTSLLIAGGLELLAGFRSGAGASGGRALLSALTAGAGAAIYHLQRSHVRWLLSAGTVPALEAHVAQGERRQDEQAQHGGGDQPAQDDDGHRAFDLPAGITAAERER